MASLKSRLIKPLAGYITRRIMDDALRGVEKQQEWRKKLIRQAAKTQFGRAHRFEQITTYQDFRQGVPLRDYEQLSPYIEAIIGGQNDVLWPGKPLYFAKTSGTTSGTKYIPISRHSISNHFVTARNALFAYVAETGKADFFDGKMIFLSGSPVLDQKGGVHCGRLSGIVNHHIPVWLRGNQLPSYPTNCIEDWEQKLAAIVGETMGRDMRLISGIPPWVQMYFDKLSAQSDGKTIRQIFPNFQVLVYGGVNFQPYRAKLQASIGSPFDSVETYPASEGFIAYQDRQNESGLLLNTNSGIFFEFVPANEIFSPAPTRLSLEEVELGVNYALIINNNAGLWGYNIGDTVKFVSLSPPKIVVTGRIKHFISAFGEHVIGEEVEGAMATVSEQLGMRIIEFTVAPQVHPSHDGLPYHEWWIEFEGTPTVAQTEQFAQRLDNFMCAKNSYYADLIKGHILQPLLIRALPHGAFRQYMSAIGKLGGQNKVPRLSNDRNIADVLQKMFVDLDN